MTTHSSILARRIPWTEPLGGYSPWHGSQTVGGGGETKKLMGIRLLEICRPLLGVWGFPGGSDGKVSACNAGDPGLIPGLGRSPGEGNVSPRQ